MAQILTCSDLSYYILYLFSLEHNILHNSLLSSANTWQTWSTSGNILFSRDSTCPSL